jgi:hypothetical protein
MTRGASMGTSNRIPRLSATVSDLAGQGEALLHERDPRHWVSLDRSRLADVQEGGEVHILQPAQSRMAWSGEVGTAHRT